ncbi:MAG: methionine adenosyltransferase [Defluviitaleaceae bacterium]|nr:methionine adenosyltransferase [Defluviitaleaceae bacterium]
MARRIFTSESVTEGHPDKLCDQISDSILDAMLSKDPMSRVACETVVTAGLVMVTGEVTTSCYVDIDKIVRDTVCSIGYDNAECGFSGSNCAVIVTLQGQSPDIAMGVDASFEKRQGEDDKSHGAGDQGMMFGYACSETAEFMPMPIYLAHKLTKRLAEVRRNGTLPFLYPDGKSQVTVLYEDDKPIAVTDIVISAQHSADVSQETIEESIINHVINHVVPSELLKEDTKYYINPTGRFVIGGPVGDSGLTGRKIIVDTYGGYAAHGGGAFSGKDPTKVDRSAAYMARYVAKNIVASGIAGKCQVELSYAIGVAHPISVFVNTYGTGKFSDERISEIIFECFDMRPTSIINKFDLRRPIYKQVAAYGHFGRSDLDLPWEKLDMVDELKGKL